MSQRQQYGASMRAIPLFVAHHSEHRSVTGILPLAWTTRRLRACHRSCVRAARSLITGQKKPDVQDLPHIRWREEEAVMTSISAEPAHRSMGELHAALEVIPADDPRNYLRQSLQLLVPL
jgi:hypothetical protein